MTINPLTASTRSDATLNDGSNTQTGTSGLQQQQITTQDFMTLLTTQLQNQDPTNPVDPTQFVTQLAEFTTLDQVSQINGLLQELVQGALAPSGSQASPGTASNPSSGSGTTPPNTNSL